MYMQTKMYRLYRKMTWSFFYIIYTFLSGYNMVLLLKVYVKSFCLDPSNSVILRGWDVSSD